MGHSIARDLRSISGNSSLMCVSEQNMKGTQQIFPHHEKARIWARAAHIWSEG
jgi:hypothetical protein